MQNAPYAFDDNTGSAGAAAASAVQSAANNSDNRGTSTTAIPPSVTRSALGIPRIWDRSRVRTDGTISLTREEESLFQLLIDVNTKYDLNATLRVAGGWVRDKCLGGNPHDIDVALDNMNGLAFAEKVNAVLSERGEATHTIGVIQSNPEQSKHLETATVNVNGQWIDFVHLRTEEYALGSRIPSSVGIGTPGEDALRRDLTINALFYNINTGKIEDFTGRGLADLRDGVIRTPLAPLTTYLDDPLRVLRTVRFASRFHCAIDEEAIQAAQDERVRDALAHKVSRERVGSELLGSFDVDPVHAFRLLYKMLLYDVVFKLPPTVTIQGHYRYRSLELMAQMDRLLASVNTTKLERVGASVSQEKLDDAAAGHIVGRGLSADSVRLYMCAAFFLPISTYMYKNAKGRKEHAIRYILEQQIKWPTREVDTIIRLCQGARTLGDFVHEVFDWKRGLASSSSSADTTIDSSTGGSAAAASVSVLSRLSMRRKIGLAIRDVGEDWRGSLAVAAVQELPALNFDMLATDMLLHWEALDEFDNDVQKALEPYHVFIHVVSELDLADVLEFRAMFSGRELADIVGRKELGPWTGDLLNSCVAWQLEHPDANEAEVKTFLCEAALSQPDTLINPRRGGKKPRT